MLARPSTVAALLVIAALPSSFPAPSAAAEQGQTLQQIWKSLEGRVGTLEHTDCEYVFVVSSPSQVGHATVVEVAVDFAVIEVRRDGGRTRLTVPLARLVLREPRR